MIELLKRSKVPFLVLVVLLCIPLFALSAGASENLVPADMRQWETINAVGTSSITYYAGGQGNEITLTPSNNIYFVGIVNGVDYIAGHTYNLTFGSTYNEISHLTWGFGYRTGADTFQFLSSSNTISSANKMSFVAPDTVNSVYVIFIFDGTTRQNIQINHLLCVDVTASEQQAVIDNANENTNKIGGWFTQLWERLQIAFAGLADSIEGIFYKEYVLSPEWVHCYLNNGALVANDTSACTSGAFVVSDSCVVSWIPNSTFRIAQYLGDQYVQTFVFSPSASGGSTELDAGFSYRVSFNNLSAVSRYDEGDPLDNFMNSLVIIRNKLSVFDRLANMILYFNADGLYTNPFTFGNVEGVSEYTAHIQGAFDGFNDGINDFVAPIGVVNAVLDEVVGEWGFVAIAVTFVLSALVLIRLLGV